MSRRIEITVPNAWAFFVRETLERDALVEKEIEVEYDKVHKKTGVVYKKKRKIKKKVYGCNLKTGSGKAGMIVELTGKYNTVFLVTVGAAAVSGIMDVLRKNAIGEAVGRIILSPLELMKPALQEPLLALQTANAKSEKEEDLEAAVEEMKAKPKPPQQLKGYEQFKLARKTTEELKADITNSASMTINTWLSLIGASIMAAGGLTTNVTVFIVAAMLTSPIMGPILGMTFGYRIADYQLFKLGVVNEFKMACCAFLTGMGYGLLLGDVGNTYQWPNDSMMPEKAQGFNLIISIIVSAAAGLVLGVALTGPFSNSLVGTAISAGLLPPIVNAGMLIAYAMVYAPIDARGPFYEMGSYAIIFYSTHVVTIVFVANFVFWLKDVNPRFKEIEDANFDDLPSILEHKERLAKMMEGREGGNALQASLEMERLKANYFFTEGMADLKKDLTKLKDQSLGFVTNVKDRVEGLVQTGDFKEFVSMGGGSRRRNSSVAANTEGDVEMGPTTYSPMGHHNESMASSSSSSSSSAHKGGKNRSNSVNSVGSTGNANKASSSPGGLEGIKEENNEGRHGQHHHDDDDDDDDHVEEVSTSKAGGSVHNKPSSAPVKNVNNNNNNKVPPPIAKPSTSGYSSLSSSYINVGVDDEEESVL